MIFLTFVKGVPELITQNFGVQKKIISLKTHFLMIDGSYCCISQFSKKSSYILYRKLLQYKICLPTCFTFCLLSRYWFHTGFATATQQYSVWTPVNTAKRTKQIEGCSDGKFILYGFQQGFALGVKDNPPLLQCSIRKGSPSQEFLDELKSEVHKGRIIGPFPHKPPGLQISPLRVIPKPESIKVRIIFNLSQPVGKSVNDNILEARKPVKYCSVHEVGQHLFSFSHRKAWLTKFDLTDAYRMVPIRKRDWKYLGMAVIGKYFIDRMLSMGASSSCQLF